MRRWTSPGFGIASELSCRGRQVRNIVPFTVARLRRALTDFRFQRRAWFEPYSARETTSSVAVSSIEKDCTVRNEIAINFHDSLRAPGKARAGIARFEGTLSSPTFFKNIPIQMPHRNILLRLGYRKSRTQLSSAQSGVLEQRMAAGFALCRPEGCWTRIDIVEHRDDAVELADGTVWKSASLAELLRRSTAAVLMAATVGPDIVRAAGDFAKKEDGVQAVILDAVGGQSAEAAITWINDYIRQQLRRRGECLTQHRFSPGYGDLHLTTQRDICRLLALDRMGVTLTSGCMLTPEKSVTAVAGIERMGSTEE